MKHYGLIQLEKKIEKEEDYNFVFTNIMITMENGILTTDIVEKTKVENVEKIVNTKKMLLCLPKDIKVSFYLSNVSGTFTIHDCVKKETFLKNFGLKDLNQEWERFREKCEMMEINPEELEKKLGI